MQRNTTQTLCFEAAVSVSFQEFFVSLVGDNYQPLHGFDCVITIVSVLIALLSQEPDA